MEVVHVHVSCTFCYAEYVLADMPGFVIPSPHNVNPTNLQPQILNPKRITSLTLSLSLNLETKSLNLNLKSSNPKP